MSATSSGSTAFKLEDGREHHENGGYRYWPYYHPQSAPGVPFGYPPGPSHVQQHAQTASASARAHHIPQSVHIPNGAAPVAPGPTEYVATPCPDCGQVVKVSATTSYHMDKHRESQRCKKAAVRRTMKEEEARASALRTELFRGSPSRVGASGQSVGSGHGDTAVASGVVCASSSVQTGSVGATRAKGKEREVVRVEKRYRDAGVQADLLLPQLSIPEAFPSRKGHRRCQSEPLPLDDSSPVVLSPLSALVKANASPKDEKPEQDSVSCLQCGETLLRRNVRNHVGAHVLRQLVGAPEGPSMKYAVHPGITCGFCGRGGCDTQLVKAQSAASKYTATASSCPHAHTFSLNKARRFSHVMPCTNVPLQCALCPKDAHTRLRPVFWKYSMFHHIQTAHPDHWDWHAHRVRGLGINFRRLLSISQKELDTVAPGRTRPYPGPIGDADEDEDEPVISNKRAAVEALLRGTSGASSPKRLKES